MKLQEEAMLVSLNICQWTARKMDKSVTSKVAELYGASRDAGRYNKVLIAQEKIREISAIYNKMRAYHYDVTLPWGRKGESLLPNKLFQEYLVEMGKLKAEAEVAKEAFFQAYPDLVEDAKGRLNGLYNPADYPTLSKVRDKYRCEWEFLPVPAGQDFRVRVSEEHRAEIAANIEANVKSNIDVAMRDLWNRLYETVQHIKERLSETSGVDKQGNPKDAVFRDSLVENAREICKLLPKLNILDDPDLEKMRAEVEKHLTQHEAETLRADKRTRQETADKAAEILRKMSAYMA